MDPGILNQMLNGLNRPQTQPSTFPARPGATTRMGNDPSANYGNDMFGNAYSRGMGNGGRNGGGYGGGGGGGW